MDGGERNSYTRFVEAMARSCYERGYSDTTVADLLCATGLTQGDFDRHFAGKEDCAVAAVDQVLGEGIAAVDASFSGDIAEAESALRALLALLELFAEKEHMGEPRSHRLSPATAEGRVRALRGRVLDLDRDVGPTPR